MYLKTQILFCSYTWQKRPHPITPNIVGSTYFHHVEPNVPRPDNYIRRVFDITDVGAVVNRLNIFYIDGCIFLVEVPSPGDAVFKRRIIPNVHLSLWVVEKLQWENKSPWASHSRSRIPIVWTSRAVPLGDPSKSTPTAGEQITQGFGKGTSLPHLSGFHHRMVW